MIRTMPCDDMYYAMGGSLRPFSPDYRNYENRKYILKVGNKISNINGERRSKSFLFQSIGTAILRGNASCVMGTTGSMGKLEELNYLNQF